MRAITRAHAEAGIVAVYLYCKLLGLRGLSSGGCTEEEFQNATAKLDSLVVSLGFYSGIAALAETVARDYFEIEEALLLRAGGDS